MSQFERLYLLLLLVQTVMQGSEKVMQRSEKVMQGWARVMRNRRKKK